MSLSQLMERLAAFEPTEFPVVSLYLNAQADQHGRTNFDQFLRKEMSERAKTFEPHTPERESFDRDVERINTYLEQEVRPSSNGIAIFACAGANDFFEAVQLDAPIERHRLFVYNQPRPDDLVEQGSEGSDVQLESPGDQERAVPEGAVLANTPDRGR